MLYDKLCEQNRYVLVKATLRHSEVSCANVCVCVLNTKYTIYIQLYMHVCMYA